MGTVTIELGGNIALVGFESRDFAELIVVKKVVGQYARRMSDAAPLSRLEVELVSEPGALEVSCRARVGERTVDARSAGTNLFVVLDDALKLLSGQLQVI